MGEDEKDRSKHKASMTPDRHPLCRSIGSWRYLPSSDERRKLNGDRRSLAVRTSACSLSSAFNSREISRALLKLPRASKRESCSISPSCSVDIGVVPCSSLIAHCLRTPPPDQVNVWQCCGLAVALSATLDGSMATRRATRTQQKAAAEVVQRRLCQAGV